MSGCGDYQIKELKSAWKVGKNNGKLSVFYEISKELCSTKEEVEEYIKKHISEEENICPK